MGSVSFTWEHFPGKYSWYQSVDYENCIFEIISYLGMKSWDLQVCDRASTITHVDREKKNSAYYNNKMFYFFLG